jgi:hypothetical protein
VATTLWVYDGFDMHGYAIYRHFSGRRSVQIEILRSMPSWRKFQLWNDLNMAMRQVALSGLSARFPSATPQELRRRSATLLLGPVLATQVYGPEPDPPTIR